MGESRSYPHRRRLGDTGRELVFKAVDESPVALTIRDIGSKVFEELAIKKRELRRILTRLLEQGKIQEEEYRVTYSRRPRIDVVVATVYYTKEEQRRRYESQVLPELEGQARADIGERNTRQGGL